MNSIHILHSILAKAVPIPYAHQAVVATVVHHHTLTTAGLQLEVEFRYRDSTAPLARTRCEFRRIVLSE